MKISGFQKLTLLDYPGKMACIVFTPGCNFRCPFCHNASLVEPGEAREDIASDEVLSYLNKRQGLLEGVVITGGEPLMQKDLEPFLHRIRELSYHIKLDTNGSFPAHLQALLSQQLVDYVAMDVKNASDKYGRAVGRPTQEIVPLIEESMTLLRQSGIPYEFRTTVVRGLHEKGDIVDIARWIQGEEPYYLQSYVDSGNVLSPEGFSAFSPDEMKEILHLVHQYCPHVTLRGVT